MGLRSAPGRGRVGDQPDQSGDAAAAGHLWTFTGQKFTELGGLTGPLLYQKDGLPKIPYCGFPAISNDANTGWKTVVFQPTCTDVKAPSDPQNNA